MRGKVENLTASILKPGFGSDALHIGQSEAEVIAVLGKPESRTRKYKGQYFYNYPLRGLEVDFGERGGSVKYIFYFRGGIRGNRQAEVVTDVGVAPGDVRDKVLQLLGPPDERGAPVTLHSGTRFGEWFRYRSGINFQFGDDGRVDMITITWPISQ